MKQSLVPVQNRISRPTLTSAVSASISLEINSAVNIWKHRTAAETTKGFW